MLKAATGGALFPVVQVVRSYHNLVLLPSAAAPQPNWNAAVCYLYIFALVSPALSVMCDVGMWGWSGQPIQRNEDVSQLLPLLYVCA